MSSSRWFWDTRHILTVKIGKQSNILDSFHQYLGIITLIIGGKHIGDYQHAVPTDIWEPEREHQARFLLENPITPRTSLEINEAYNYDMLVELRATQGESKSFV